MNVFLSRDFWRVRLDIGFRLGLSSDAVFNRGQKELFYGLQIRTHWAISKQKIYLGIIALYGDFDDNSYYSSGSSFALIPVSIIYVF